MPHVRISGQRPAMEPNFGESPDEPSVPLNVPTWWEFDEICPYLMSNVPEYYTKTRAWGIFCLQNHWLWVVLYLVWHLSTVSDTFTVSQHHWWYFLSLFMVYNTKNCHLIYMLAVNLSIWFLRYLLLYGLVECYSLAIAYMVFILLWL